MGQYVNPGNKLFYEQIHSQVYVDKTGLLSFTNSAIDTYDRFICNSRPRRFGKSYAADMLAAYYSRGCDSNELFSDFEIAKSCDYRKYLNRYDVIRFDVQWLRSQANNNGEDVINFINHSIVREMIDEYPDCDLSGGDAISSAMFKVNARTGRTFAVIIDEWDSIIRDKSSDQGLVDRYIDFLRSMFKGTDPMNYISLAYLTGILPIKRQQTQSALNNFKEFTMIQPKTFAPYVGFTDQEVSALCEKYNADYDSIKKWYDGYILGDYQVYNPNAVVDAVRYGTLGSSWTETSSFNAVRPYINMNFDGLKTDLIDMISGTRVRVNTATFENHTDKSAFNSKDDVFTYMIHLGYLAFDPKKQEAFVPNEEIRQVLGQEVANCRWTEFDSFEKESDALFEATVEGDTKTVAAEIEKIHERYASAIWYNNENSLASTISIAYLSTLKYYFKPFREMPTGKGFADIVYLPLPEYLSDIPALVIELKWNRDAHTAIDQIKDRDYPDSVAEYTGDMILVGITYDKKTKQHSCEIEKMEKCVTGDAFR